jgi:hypothetical protein
MVDDYGKHSTCFVEARMKVESCLKNTRWRTLYTAALFENDRSKVPALISEAEAEIVKRAHMLFGAPGDNFDESEALDDALYMLHALKNCLKVQGPGQMAA